MEKFLVEAEVRDELGKNANRRLRSAGLIPGVVYGREIDSISIKVDPQEIERILDSEAGQNTVFKLKVKGETRDVLIKDFDLDPVRDHLLHADFHAISLDQKLTFEVPVEAVGTAEGVKMGGVLDLVLHSLEVECLPGDVPDNIRVDVSELEVGDSVRVSDIQVDTSKVEVLSDADLVVLTVIPPHVEEEEEPEVEEEVLEPELIRKAKPEEESEGESE